MVKNNQVTIIIVSYNNSRTITRCLNSVLKFSNGSPIIVVDNHSQDGTQEIVKKNKLVRFIELEQNLGFSRANNLAAKSVSTQYLVFLNPDTTLTKRDCFSRMGSLLQKNLDYGLIGPKIVYPDGRLQKNAKNLPTLWRAIEEYLLGIKGKYDFYHPNCTKLCQVESVRGACMVISARLFWSIGGFNQKYFLYYEDLDLCRGIYRQGLKIGFDPETEIEHTEGESGFGSNTRKLLVQSAVKYHGLVNYLLITLVLKIHNLLHD